MEFISCSVGLGASEESQSWPRAERKRGSGQREGALTPHYSCQALLLLTRRPEEEEEVEEAMAEPLLRRTFSRLRGRDRSRRKTEAKLSGEQRQRNATVF